MIVVKSPLHKHTNDVLSKRSHQAVGQDLGTERGLGAAVSASFRVSLRSGRLPSTFPIGYGSCQPRLYPFCDQRTLKLGSASNRLEPEFAGWQRRINRLRHGDKINAQRPAQLESEISAFRLLAKRSNFQSTTTSTDPRRQSLCSSFSAGPLETRSRLSLITVAF
jgi:hypothetical protein